jgi:DNA ligase-associated metallophosphoesterase
MTRVAIGSSSEVFLTVDFSGQQMLLLPEKALYWPQKQTLIIADLHLGKTTHFRREGLYLPSDLAQKQLEPVVALCNRWEAEKLLILGDLFHSKTVEDQIHLQKWTSTPLAPEIVLVRGNHDKLDDVFYHGCGLNTVVTHLQIGTLSFGHFQTGEDLPEGYFHFSGHLHPSYTVGRGKVGQVALPCFWVRGDGNVILPAIGAFTGCSRIKPAEADKVFAVVGSSVRRVC